MSLVVRALGFHIYISSSIITRVEIFPFVSVTFFMLLRVFYLYDCLEATVLHIYILFISQNVCEQGERRVSCNAKFAYKYIDKIKYLVHKLLAMSNFSLFA